jgi:hypothetical protein
MKPTVISLGNTAPKRYNALSPLIRALKAPIIIGFKPMRLRSNLANFAQTPPLRNTRQNSLLIAVF